MSEYKNNQEPKVGDRVRFKSDEDKTIYTVTSVGGGRLGNKVCVVPLSYPDTFGREYYYSCFEKVADEPEGPMEMMLCEQDMVILKPDQLYIFRHDPACPRCNRIKEQLGS